MNTDYSNRIQTIQAENTRLHEWASSCVQEINTEFQTKVSPKTEAIHQRFSDNFPPVLDNLKNGKFVQSEELRKLVENVMLNKPKSELKLGNLDKYRESKNVLINTLRRLIHKIKLVFFKTYADKFNLAVEKITQIFQKNINDEIDHILAVFREKKIGVFKKIEIELQAEMKIINELAEDLLQKIGEVTKAIEKELETEKSEIPSQPVQKVEVESKGGFFKKFRKKKKVQPAITNTPAPIEKKTDKLYVELENLQNQLAELESEREKLKNEQENIKAKANNKEFVPEKREPINNPTDKVQTNAPQASKEKSLSTSQIEFEELILEKLEVADRSLLTSFQIPLRLIGWLFEGNIKELASITLKKGKKKFELIFKLANTVQKYVHQSTTKKIEGGKLYNVGDNPEREVIISLNTTETMQVDVIKGIETHIKSMMWPVKGEIKASVVLINILWNSEKKKYSMKEYSANQVYADGSTSNTLQATAKMQEALVKIPLTGEYGLFTWRTQQSTGVGQKPFEFHKAQREFFNSKS